MGYRSDVGIVVNMEELSAALDALPKNERKEIEELLAEADVTRIGPLGMRLYVWESIKWYTSQHPCRHWVENFARNTSEDGVFTRIGEDIADIEEGGNLERGSEKDCFDLSVSRILTYNG